MSAEGWTEEEVCKTFMQAMTHYDKLSQSFKLIGKGYASALKKIKQQEEMLEQTAKDPNVNKLLAAQQSEIADLRNALEVKQQKIDDLEADKLTLQATINSLTDRIKVLEAANKHTATKADSKKAGRDRANMLASGLANPVLPSEKYEDVKYPERRSKRKCVEPILSPDSADALQQKPPQEPDSDTLTTLIKIMEQDTLKAQSEASLSKQDPAKMAREREKLKNADYVIGLFTQSLGSGKESDFFALAHEKKKEPAKGKKCKKCHQAIEGKRGHVCKGQRMLD